MPKSGEMLKKYVYFTHRRKYDCVLPCGTSKDCCRHKEFSRTEMERENKTKDTVPVTLVCAHTPTQRRRFHRCYSPCLFPKH